MTRFEEVSKALEQCSRLPGCAEVLEALKRILRYGYLRTPRVLKYERRTVRTGLRAASAKTYNGPTEDYCGKKQDLAKKTSKL